MSTVRLPTQFDGPHRPALAVATPTCCSCCCCCCAVTVATSATLTAVHLNATAAVRAPVSRPIVTVAGALSMPAAAGVLIGVSQLPGLAYGARWALAALVVATLLGGLFHLYRRAGHPKPWLLPPAIVGVSVVGVVLEFGFAVGLGFGGALVLEGLAIPVPVLAGIALYRKLKARRESGTGRA